MQVQIRNADWLIYEDCNLVNIYWFNKLWIWILSAAGNSVICVGCVQSIHGDSMEQEECVTGVKRMYSWQGNYNKYSHLCAGLTICAHLILYFPFRTISIGLEVQEIESERLMIRSVNVKDSFLTLRLSLTKFKLICFTKEVNKLNSNPFKHIFSETYIATKCLKQKFEMLKNKQDL